MFELLTVSLLAATAVFAVLCSRSVPYKGRCVPDTRTMTNETDWRWYQAES